MMHLARVFGRESVATWCRRAVVAEVTTTRLDDVDCDACRARFDADRQQQLPREVAQRLPGAPRSRWEESD